MRVNKNKIWDKILEIESDNYNSLIAVAQYLEKHIEKVLNEGVDRQMGKRLTRLEEMLVDMRNTLMRTNQDIEDITKTLTYTCEECKQGFRDMTQVYNVHKVGGHGYRHLCAYCLKKCEDN